MVAILLLPLFVIAQSWVVVWILKWFISVNRVFDRRIIKISVIAIYFVCVLSMYIAFFLPNGRVEKFFRVLGYYWYGIKMYVFLIFIFIQIIRALIKHSRFRDKRWVSSRRTIAISGTLSIALVVIICVAGHINAKNIHITNYEVKIDKGCPLSELNAVLIADQHLGYNIGAEMMEQMVEKINLCKPDIVFVAGDIFDNCFANIEEPDRVAEILRGIKSKYGVYAVLGNHDCEEPIVGGFTFPSKEKKMASEEMYKFVEDSNFKLICDEGILIDDSFYIYGRPDEERPGKYVEDERKTEQELMSTMDARKPVIVFEHEPKFLGALDEAGVDLHLAGHTHDGQLFPLNIATDIIWENPYGLLEKSHMTSIVTSGVGLYGPFIRVGTIAEICNIHITFSE